MNNHIQIGDAKLSATAIEFIESIQEENNTAAIDMEKDLTSLLIEVIQQNFGDDQRDKFIKVLADSIDLAHRLQA